ncbi:MAG: DNA mismatch repair endonuclease MutL [Chloroflexi bacterium]|nr:DNA mismatch repair endonuclease MutL [Chloroflexota bacterium]
MRVTIDDTISLMAIQILSEQLASQIAAGEVVERPSSVVKELVENGIDAGATTINVDIRQAGRQSIQIADNGSGIPAADIEIAFHRHATSKLRGIEDLNAIRTLGFRGEALAAVSAVSQVTLISRVADEEYGTRLVLEGGIKRSSDTVGAPQGTVIAVENLFYNVPARLKFLKSDKTEKRLIDEFVTCYALAYPHIRFRLTHNGRITFQSNGNGNVLDVLLSLYGPEVARQLLEIGDSRLEIEEDSTISNNQSPISISGFIGPPSVHWSNRGKIVLFVNGRWVKDNKLTYAVIQAYHTLLPSGRYPLAALFLELPPNQVDVNVHPAKTEVRFRGGKAPFGEVQRAVRQTLVAEAPIRHMSAWNIGSQIEAMTPGWEGNLDQHAFTRPDDKPQAALDLTWDTADSDSPNREADNDNLLPVMRVVGQIGAAYIITEGPDGVFLIDQQAAHERVLYERYLAQWQGKRVETKTLSAGTAVTLAPTQSEWLNKQLKLLAEIGFHVEPFGPQTVMVRAIPTLVAAQDAAHLLLAIVTRQERQPVSAAELPGQLIQIVAEAAAVRAGQSLNSTQMEELIQQLEKCAHPMTNPQGKPTFIYLSVAQLAREFGRI